MPVSITSKLLSFLLDSSDSQYPVIRRIISSKKGNYFHSRLGISSSYVREVFKKHLSDISRFGTHSLKSGGATKAGNSMVDPHLLDGHAGWKCKKTKLRYIGVSHDHLLTVSDSLNL